MGLTGRLQRGVRTRNRARCLAAAAASWMGMAGVTWAGRPLNIDDADPVDAGLFEFEGGAGYFRDSECRHWDLPFGLTYGLIEEVEVGVGFGGQFEKRSEVLGESRGSRHVHEDGIGDLTLGAKWRFLKEAGWCPRQALVPSVKFPTADEDDGLGSGETDFDLTWIASKALTEKLGAHVNAGYSFIGQPEGEDVGDVVHYGVALDYRLCDALQWVGEVTAEKELENGGGTAVEYNTGFRYALADALVLDAAAGSRICGDGTPDFTGTVGLTWTFGFADKE